MTPATTLMPVYMLKKGDMILHEETDWFYQVAHDGAYPAGIYCRSVEDLGAGVRMPVPLVAIDREAARQYNVQRRAATIAIGRGDAYPREAGDVIVLGPGGSVLNWEGVNYVPQAAPDPTDTA